MIGIVILLGLVAEFEVGILVYQVIRVHGANQIGHLHQVLILIEKRPIEQGQQEGPNGQHRHNAAHDHGNGGDPVPFLPLALLLLFAKGCPAHCLGILAHRAAGGGVLVHSQALLRHPAGRLADPARILAGPLAPGRIGDPVFGVGHPLRRGLGIGGGHALDGNGVLRGPTGLVLKVNGGILPELLHILEHFCGGGIPVLGLQRHTLEDDLLQPRRDIGVQAGGLGRAAVDVLDGHRHRGFPVEGGPPGHHLVHHNAEGIDVRPAVGIAALGLFRGDIVDGAQGFLGQGVALAHDPGNAKIHHLDAAVFQHHDVVGLDVPVDNAPAVGVLQALGDLHGEVQGLLPIEDPLHLHILLQRDAVDQLHDQVVGIVRRGDVIDLDNVRVAQHRHGLALRPEPAAELIISRKFVF